MLRKYKVEPQSDAKDAESSRRKKNRSKPLWTPLLGWQLKRYCTYTCLREHLAQLETQVPPILKPHLNSPGHLSPHLIKHWDHMSYTLNLCINWKIHYMYSAQALGCPYTYMHLHTHPTESIADIRCYWQHQLRLTTSLTVDASFKAVCKMCMGSKMNRSRCV